MGEVGTLLTRAAVGIVGAVFVYASLFLYDEEEGRFESALNRSWQKIRDLHSHALSSQAAFVRVVANITSKGFELVFGKRLFGLKAIAAAMCYSLASIIFYMIVGIIVFVKRSDYAEMPSTATFLVLSFFCLFFLLLGSLGPLIQRTRSKLVWLVCALLAAFGWAPLLELILNALGSALSMNVEGSFLKSGWFFIPVAVICDFLFIVVTRVMLRQISQSQSIWRIALLLTSNVLLAIALFIIPWAGAAIIHEQDASSLIAEGLVLIAFSNCFDLLISVAGIAVALVMLIHRLLWPLMERPLYALQRHHILTKQKKVLFFVGVALIGIALPSVGAAILNIVKSIHI